MTQTSRTSEYKLGESRRRILEALAQYGALTFTEVKEALKLTDGNLSHLAVALKAKGHITIERRLGRKFTTTTYTITDHGRAALAAAVQAVQQ